MSPWRPVDTLAARGPPATNPAVFGWATIRALADEGFGAFQVPWADLAIDLVIAGIAGALAAVYPAIEASRLDILRAIAYE